jgi:hypothetical protein
VPSKGCLSRGVELRSRVKMLPEWQQIEPRSVLHTVNARRFTALVTPRRGFSGSADQRAMCPKWLSIFTVS